MTEPEFNFIEGVLFGSPFLVIKIGVGLIFLTWAVGLIYGKLSKSESFEISIHEKELIIKKNIVYSVYMLCLGFLYSIILGYVIAVGTFIQRDFELKWIGYLVAFLIFSFLLVRDILEFRNRGDISIKMIDFQRASVNSIFFQLDDGYRLRTASSVNSQGSKFSDLYLDIENKSIKLVDGVNDERIEYAQKTILSFLKGFKNDG